MAVSLLEIIILALLLIFAIGAFSGRRNSQDHRQRARRRRNFVLGLIAVTLPLFVLFFFSGRQVQSPPQSSVGRGAAERLTNREAIREQETPPPAWTEEPESYLADVYPTQHDAAAALARHSLTRIEEVIREDTPNGREYSREQAANAILIKEEARLQIAPSTLSRLASDLQTLFPSANVLKFDTSIDTTLSSIETLGEPKPVFVVVSTDDKPSQETSEIKLSIGNENQYQDVRVQFTESSWVTGNNLKGAVRFRSQELERSREKTADELYDQVADSLAAEFAKTHFRIGLPEDFDAKARIRECLSADAVSERFTQTLTTPDGDSLHRMAILFESRDIGKFFNRISADPRGDHTVGRIGTVLPYFGLLAFVVVAWFVLRQISNQLSESNMANLA